MGWASIVNAKTGQPSLPPEAILLRIDSKPPEGYRYLYTGRFPAGRMDLTDRDKQTGRAFETPRSEDVFQELEVWVPKPIT